MAETEVGRWGPVLSFPNVAVHAHVLPDGHVLMWGRRDDPHGGLDPHDCTPFIWDPRDPTVSADATEAKTVNTPQPTLADGVTTVNLFCGGHAFLPDGRLLALGGHLADGDGVNQAALYTVGRDGGPGAWHATAIMNHGRWYPTATTLPDGSVLTLAGSWIEHPHEPPRHHEEPQVWSNGGWRTLARFPLGSMDLYPRAHVISDGRVFISGPLESTWLLDTTGTGSWQQTGAHHLGQFDYAPAVMYDEDKIVYIGGGGGAHHIPPTNQAKVVDFTKPSLAWEPAGSMHFGRRQHNATLLPDGSVLVTGGTRGSGFNNLDAGMPVHEAELWDSQTRTWTVLAAESVDRCYHSTAVLLPDATVLSAGGGEFKEGAAPNHPRHNHRDGQIFHPPYLFRGARPEITSAPDASVTYGETFDVSSPQANDISRATWIGLSSVTHAFNQSQRINRLAFKAVNNNTLRIIAPASPNVCPPGHYMLFVLSSAGVPSVAKILQIQASGPSRVLSLAGHTLRRIGRRVGAPLWLARGEQPQRRGAEVVAGPQASVVVGLTSTCPYGLGACWGGAHEALGRLEGVDRVGAVANTADSTAEIFLTKPGLPALNRWVEQFAGIVNGRYEWRGVEMTVRGAIEEHDGVLSLAADESRPAVTLQPITAEAKIQWDMTSQTRKPLHPTESDAYAELHDAVSAMAEDRTMIVTGPLQQTPSGYVLAVREFHTPGRR